MTFYEKRMIKTTKADARFVLYNNRSLHGVTLNFLGDLRLDAERLLKMDADLRKCDMSYRDESTVQIDTRDLVFGDDFSYGPTEVSGCTYLAREAQEALLNPSSIHEEAELSWLYDRGLGTDEIRCYNLGSLSKLISVATAWSLDVLGITRHPMLRNIIDDDLSGGGILFPLYSRGRLVNMTTRRISDVGKLKYTQACPDMHVWGLSRQSKQHPTWVVEGILDMIAVNTSTSEFSSAGVSQAVSVSGAMWSTPQLLQLVDGTGENVNIFADNDKVGLRSAAVLKMLLQMYGKRCKTFVSKFSKDPSEHFASGYGWLDVEEIDITPDMIRRSPDMTFNFTKYLRNRNF